MPCLGRMLYDYLRHKYMMPYIKYQPSLRRLRGNSEFPRGLAKVKGEAEQVEMRAHRNFACRRLISAVQSHCGGYAHYEKLAILLNHGKSCPSPLQDGYFGPIRLQLIKTNFSERMLRHRSSLANPFLIYLVILSLPLKRVWEFMNFMRSSGD